MPALRTTLACVALVAAAGGVTAGPAQAAPLWSGRYTVVTYASEKIGTSVAARQPEPDFSAQYTFSTACEGIARIAPVKHKKSHAQAVSTSGGQVTMKKPS